MRGYITSSEAVLPLFVCGCGRSGACAASSLAESARAGLGLAIRAGLQRSRAERRLRSADNLDAVMDRGVQTMKQALEDVG